MTKSVATNLFIGGGLVVFGVLFIIIGTGLGISSLHLFAILYLNLLYTYFPKYLISPTSVIFGYYALFYIVAPYYADRYSASNFSSLPYTIAYSMAYTVLTVSIMSATIGEKLSPALSDPSNSITSKLDSVISRNFILTFYCLATASVIAVVLASGGLSVWILHPGDAFLNRQGSGVFVVLSHLFTYCLAISVGHYSFVNKSKSYIFIFVAWLILTSPVHGSKGLLSFLLILSFIPWLRTVRTLSRHFLYVSVAFVIIFFAGLYYRNINWLTLEEALPYALNYFTVVSNLILSIEDFSPDFLTTFFLPFNKFLTPFGISDYSLYYDMNHKLTDHYFPTAWEIRATEQWPVETDLYLNFYFILGLPLIFGFFSFIGYIFGNAQKRQSLGLWAASYAMIFSIIPHLRGSLYNHTDFYYYPMILFIYFLFRKVSLQTAETVTLRNEPISTRTGKTKLWSGV